MKLDVELSDRSSWERILTEVKAHGATQVSRSGAPGLKALSAVEVTFSTGGAPFATATGQIIHLTEFDDFAAYQAYREAAASDGDANEGVAQLTNLAPEQRIEILEPLGPVAPQRLRKAIADSTEKAVGVYTFAILDVTPAKIEPFTALLESAAAALPIVAALRDVSGNPYRVTDLWARDTGAPGYVPNDDQQEAFFGPLRQLAPREKMMRLHVMPYSPLR